MLAIGVIAVHVVDDSFVQPQPGTSVTDHLVSGLVPLALLAAMAVLYPRLRAGARAATALLAGFFGVLVGTEAIRAVSAPFGTWTSPSITPRVTSTIRSRPPSPRRRPRRATTCPPPSPA